MDKDYMLKLDVSPRLKELLHGINKPGFFENDASMPIWFDPVLFKKGTEFFHKYFFNALVSQLLGIICSIYTLDAIALPLIFTEKSDTPRKALKRYISTTLHIVKWFENDIWTPGSEGREDIISVRNLHRNLISHFNKITNDEFNSVKTKANYLDPTSELGDYIRKDMENYQLVNIEESLNLYEEMGNQFFMAMTQYALVGFLVAHPRMMGIWWASDADIGSFLHCWRTAGWLLGLEDKYNLCSGSLEEVRSLCLEIENKIIIPRHSKISRSYELLSESIVRGINHLVPLISFPAIFLYIVSTYGLKMPQTYSRIRWNHYFQYLVMRLVFNVLFIVPATISVFNVFLRLVLSTKLKRPATKY